MHMDSVVLYWRDNRLSDVWKQFLLCPTNGSFSLGLWGNAATDSTPLQHSCHCLEVITVNVLIVYLGLTLNALLRITSPSTSSATTRRAGATSWWTWTATACWTSTLRSPPSLSVSPYNTLPSGLQERPAWGLVILKYDLMPHFHPVVRSGSVWDESGIESLAGSQNKRAEPH